MPFRHLAQSGEIPLQTVERLVGRILDTIVDGVLIIDGKGIVKYCNKACAQLFGYDTKDVVGRNVSLLMPEPYHTQHDGYITNYLKTRSPKVIGIGRELMARRQDGSVFPIDLKVGEIGQEDNPSFIGIVRDITERHDSEAQREQLRQSQKMEAIGQLTAGMAHDFNNLLAVILGNLDLLSEKIPIGDPLHRYIAPCIAAAEQGSDLTSQFLAFGRKQALKPEAIDVNELIYYLTALMKRTLSSRVTIVSEFVLDVWTVCVDPVQLQNALLNLAFNARDAMPRGGTLTFQTGHVTADGSHGVLPAGDYVMVAVRDTGEGMTPEIREKAFEPFFTTKGAGKGNGLGLSMVYGFVKQSAGHIEIDSAPGQGTTIRLYLPRSQAQAVSRTETRRSEGVAQGSATILIVEDNPDVLHMTSAMVSGMGYRILTCSNGEAALEVLSERPDIDLLLSDVMLAGTLNGPELAEQALQLRPGLKILFNSGYAEDAMQHSGLPPDIPIIAKPFRRQQLAMTIRAVLTGG